MVCVFRKELIWLESLQKSTFTKLIDIQNRNHHSFVLNIQYDYSALSEQIGSGWLSTLFIHRFKFITCHFQGCSISISRYIEKE